MNHNFQTLPTARHPRSAFDRSRSLTTTFDGGYLIPIFTEEVLPGDTVNLSLATFARLATPLHPVMDNMRMTTFFFFTPNRLVWENWEKFCGAQDNPGDSTDFLIPQVTAPIAGVQEGDLYDYMGIPTKVKEIAFSALPGRGHNLIYNEWFRSQDLQDSVEPFTTTNGPDSYTLASVYRRGKRHDYMTSCLPFPQKGPPVELPLGISAPLTLDGPNQFLAASTAGLSPVFDVGQNSVLTHTSGTKLVEWADSAIGSGNSDWVDPRLNVNVAGATGLVDLSVATSATINQLREASQIQVMYEIDARSGTRYTESILAHFGVTNPDFRLQRPEYLGGGSTMINIHPVAQTNETDAGTPQANLAAFGTASSTTHGFTKSFTEHGYIQGYVSVQADLKYQQGLDRHWSRRDRFDYFWPSFQHLGEQAVLNKEIYAQGSDFTAIDDAVFGYIGRYDEYRSAQSQITGLMRSNATGSLDTWGLWEDFASLPVLGSQFIEDNPPIDRVIAVPSEPHFLFDAYFKVRSVRPMAMFGQPGSLVGRF